MSEMKQRFPGDVDYVVSLDQTSSVTEGMKEIVETILIAIVLVIAVVYLFLQDWRATTDPVACCAGLPWWARSFSFRCSAFSINTLLALLGWYWLSGLVVDDAIVVVEGIQTPHRERSCATGRSLEKAMEELFRPGNRYRHWFSRRFSYQQPSFRESPASYTSNLP